MPRSSLKCPPKYPLPAGHRLASMPALLGSNLYSLSFLGYVSSPRSPMTTFILSALHMKTVSGIYSFPHGISPGYPLPGDLPFKTWFKNHLLLEASLIAQEEMTGPISCASSGALPHKHLLYGVLWMLPLSHSLTHCEWETHLSWLFLFSPWPA